MLSSLKSPPFIFYFLDENNFPGSSMYTINVPLIEFFVNLASNYMNFVIPRLDRGIQSFQYVLDCPVKPDNDVFKSIYLPGNKTRRSVLLRGILISGRYPFLGNQYSAFPTGTRTSYSSCPAVLPPLWQRRLPSAWPSSTGLFRVPRH